MIIDLILDRKDGTPYNPKEFYNDVMEYESVFNLDRSISSALDYGDEKEIKKALCDYVINQGYNKNIRNYINDVRWLESDVTTDRLNSDIDRITKELNNFFHDEDIQATVTSNSYVREQMMKVMDDIISAIEDYKDELRQTDKRQKL
jgi:hypothetical protein